MEATELPNPIDLTPSDRPPARPSGVRQLISAEGDEGVASSPEPGADAAIRAANAELERRTAPALELPFSVALEQRNQSLRDLHGERESRARMLDEQDRFIAALMTEYEEQLNDLRFESQARIEAVKDEVARSKWQIEEAERRLEDARDEARRESFRVREELERAQQLLEERSQETRRLRERLEELEARARTSRPPGV